MQPGSFALGKGAYIARKPIRHFVGCQLAVRLSELRKVQVQATVHDLKPHCIRVLVLLRNGTSAEALRVLSR